MTATVPTEAIRGVIIETTPSRMLTTTEFRVTPQIANFNPLDGPVGTSVTIKGVSLTRAVKVTFGGVVDPTFQISSDTEVTTTVPVGAATGNISITTDGGTAASPAPFTVTP